MFGAAIALTTLLFGVPASASDQTNLLTKAATTAQHMKQDPAFGKARDMVSSAKAVLIVPALVKGGFIFGAEGGDGVLVAKNGSNWSAPAFYTLSAASFGLQAGLEKAEVVMLLMSDKALEAIKTTDFKLGAGGGITMVSLSSGAAAATGDIVVWTSGTGLYGGLTLNGSVVKPRTEWNTAFYGRPATVNDILADKVSNPQAMPLQQQLASLQ
jgi:lipid-binding SYLF domain-containing protein